MDSAQIMMIEQFRLELSKESPALDRLALYIARIAYPNLQIEPYIAQIDQIADYIETALEEVAPGRRRAERFLALLHDDLGFDGNRESYYDPCNSFLNDLLERRVGLPILLCLLCITIGERMNLTIYGVGLPSHFMACYEDETGKWLLDPFNATVVAPTEITQYLSDMFQESVTLSADMLQPVPLRLLIVRVLNNLRQIYLNQQELGMVVQVLDYILVTTPDTALFWQERGVLHHHLQNWESAIRDLRRYFFLKGQSMLARGLSGESTYEEEVNRLTEPEQHLLGMLHHAEEMRLRLN